jgi:hypothetical protein
MHTNANKQLTNPQIKDFEMGVYMRCMDELGMQQQKRCMDECKWERMWLTDASCAWWAAA